MKTNTGQYLKIGALIWGGCLVVFLLVFMVVLSPLNKRRIQVESEYGKFKTEAEAAYLASLEQTKNRMTEKITALTEQLGDFVIEPAGTSGLTYQLNGISGEIGLNAFQCTPTGQTIAAFEQCKYVMGQYYQVSFSSSFNKFAQFLNELERYRPVIFIDTFSITRPTQGETEPKVSMSLVVLVAKEEKAAKSPKT